MGVQGGQRRVPDGTTENSADGTRTGSVLTRKLVRSWIQRGWLLERGLRSIR